MNVCIFGASSNTIDKAYINAAIELGELLAKDGNTLVFGAGNEGVMGASARGFTKGGGRIVGVAPSFFNVDGKLYAKCDELVRTDSMRERKFYMEENADAFVIAPGGIGTFEEFFEVLTLKQLAQHNKAIVILNTNGYYDELLAFMNTAVKQNFIMPACLSLYASFDTPKEVADYLYNYTPLQLSVEEMKNLGIQI